MKTILSKLSRAMSLSKIVHMRATMSKFGRRLGAFGNRAHMRATLSKFWSRVMSFGRIAPMIAILSKFGQRPGALATELP